MQPVASLQFRLSDADKPLTNILTEACVEVTWAPSDALNEFMDAHNIKRRGRTSWAIAVSEENQDEIQPLLREFLATFPVGVLRDKSNAGEISMHLNAWFDNIDEGNISFDNVSPAFGYWSPVRRTLTGFDWFPEDGMRLTEEQSDMLRNEKKTRVRSAWLSGGSVHLEFKNNSLWFRLAPAREYGRYNSSVMLPKMAGTPFRNAHTLTAIEAVELWSDIIDTTDTSDRELAAATLMDADSHDVMEILSQVKSSVTIGYAKNQPGSVWVQAGDKVVDTVPALAQFAGGSGSTLKAALALQTKHSDTVPFHVHPSLEDIVRMENAAPFEGDDNLRDYQKVAVGLHLATDIGYLQTCSPGMGKTVMQIVGMRERANNIKHYRGLIVCEANLREQWEEEMAKWFPAARVFRLGDSKNQSRDALMEALSDVRPVVVIMSYAHTLLATAVKEERDEANAYIRSLPLAERITAMAQRPVEAPTLGGLLLDSKWHDISADEAMIIRNGSSKQSRIMWELRKNSQVATALTATPINKSPDDIGRLLAWVRNDRNLFTGAPLSEQYDTTDIADARRLFETFGPLVFRRDVSEVENEIPATNPIVHMMQPNAAEHALATAAENELKRCLNEVMEALEVAETQEGSDKEAVAAAKAALRDAHGEYLGGVQLARMAISDPATLLTSTSTGAALLRGQGLVQAALDSTPTRRKLFLEEVGKRVAEGEQIVVFTDFVDVANLLVSLLTENGVKAKAYTGKNGATRDRARKEFQDGELDVIVATQSGERGLTLHKANAIVLYETPWTLEKVIQRIGRTVRIGSKHATIDVISFVMENTSEQKIAENVVQMGISASLVLDNSRGVDVKETETMKAMGGMVSAFSKRMDKESLTRFSELLTA